MLKLLLPIALSLCNPGFGQLYNRDFRKGWALIGLSFVVFICFAIWISKVVLLYLPAGVTPQTIDPAQMGPILEKIRKNFFWTYTIYTYLLIGLWVFGMVDAYIVAKRRLQPPTLGRDPESDLDQEKDN